MRQFDMEQFSNEKFQINCYVNDKFTEAKMFK